jgi:hypothetical protein
MMNNNYELIKQAIHDKKSVTFIYDRKRRDIYPYILGEKDGNKNCFAYQFSGESKSRGQIIGNGNDNWRCFDVSKMTNVTISNKAQENPNDPPDLEKLTCIDRVDVSVGV